uniref:M56 family metallopeptidase n=1 Tax=Roseihalotalea indica TaxID=2867963 RepID=A0AA49JCG4_9BACT|nr:M56 family metallopeptidase [Tunicatimonas sp. TK19036]
MTILPEVWTQTLGWTLVHSLWLLTGIALGLRLLLWIIPRRASRFRYAVSVIVLMTALIALVVTGYRIHDPQETALATPSAALVSGMIVAPPSSSAVLVEDSWRHQLTEAGQKLQVWLTPHLSGMLVLWFSGMLFFLLRTVGKLVYLHRLTRVDTYPLSTEWEASVGKLRKALAIKRKVLIRASSRIRTPFVTGLFKPVILLPVSAFSQLNYEQLEAILAHELAHIRRWDDVINWLQTAIEIVLFYHPAIWWISQIIRDEREKCCDDLAVTVCGNPLVYAKALAHMESLQQSPSELVLAFARQGASLLGRIERLLQPHASSSRTSAAPAIVSMLLVLSFLITYRMTTSIARNPDTSPTSLYSGAILSIPQLQRSEGGIAGPHSPWQPKLPEWLMEEEISVLDTVPSPDKEDSTQWYRFRFADEWAVDVDIDNDVEVELDNDFDFDMDIDIDIDTFPPSAWVGFDSAFFTLKSPKFDMAGFTIMADTNIIWKIDSSFHYQFNIADTLLPPQMLSVPIPPMPPMPDMMFLNDSLNFYEDVWREYERVFEHLDSAEFWENFSEEQQERLEEQQQRLEEMLEKREDQQEQQLQEWQERLEEWEQRQEEQMEHYRERVREWEEQTRDRLQQQEERYRDRQEEQRERKQSGEILQRKLQALQAQTQLTLQGSEQEIQELQRSLQQLQVNAAQQKSKIQQESVRAYQQLVRELQTQVRQMQHAH